MRLVGAPTVTDWSQEPMSEHSGATGHATSRTIRAGKAQMRLISYAPGYSSDSWCRKGHILFVVEGELTVEHENGRCCEIGAGMSYQVGDDYGSPHRVSSRSGATIFVVD